MTALQKITMADIKQAISKGWITNVKEADIMENPLLARIVKGEGTRGLDNNSSSTRTRTPKAKTRPVIDMFLRCPKCQQTQHEYGYYLDDRPWFKCQTCEQLIPSGAWEVLAVGNRQLT